MINHKVVDIKITYEPEHMEEGAQEELEKKLEILLEEFSKTTGTKVRAKQHNVTVDVLMDEYGLELAN